MKFNTAKNTGLTFRKVPVISTVTLLCLLAMGNRAPLRATGVTWDASATPNTAVVDGTGQWNLTGTNWLSSGVDGTYVQGSDVAFGMSGTAASRTTTNTTVALGTNITVGNLLIENDSNLGTMTISASNSILTITGSMVSSYDNNTTTISGTADFTNGLVVQNSNTIGGGASSGNGQGSITLNGVDQVVGGISEGASFGTTTLSGTVLLSGNIFLNNGTLTISGSVATMSGSAAENITASNGTVNFTGGGNYTGLVLGNITTSTGINFQNGNFAGMTIGNISVTNGGFTMSGGTFTGMVISGTIGVTGGTLDVSAANNFSTVTGITNVAVSGGILKLTTTGSNAFPAISGTFGLNGGSLNINNGLYSGTIGTGVNQLQVGNNSTLSSGTFNFNVGGLNPGGKLVWAGITGNTAGFTVGGTLALGQNAQTTNTTLVNPMDLDTSGIAVIKIGANGQSLSTLSGSISDSISGGGLEFGAANNTNQGYNWVMMSGGESYSGSTILGATNSGTTGNNNPLRLILASSGSYSSSVYAITGTAGGQLGINQSGTAYISGNIVTLTGTDNTINDNGGTDVYDPGATVIIGGSSTVNGVSGSSGLVVFTGTNTYVGNTNIDSGTLQIGNGGTAGQLPPSLTGTVAGLSNTALVYDLTSTATVNNPMKGAMGFTQAGTGLVILNNGAHQLYTGTTTISSGTLQFGDGVTDGLTTSNSPVITDNGVLVLNNISAETYTGSIGGNGSLTKSSAGNQILSGNLDYTGTTGINAGTLTLSGSNRNATAITVNNNGALVLGGTNAIVGASSLTLNSGGTVNLAIGGTTHIITMAGSATNALVLNGGTMNFGMGSNTADELVLTTGTASMGGVITITATGYGTLALSTPQALIYAPGGGLVAADFTAPSLSNAIFTVTSGTLFLSTGVTVTNAYWEGNNGTNWSTNNTWTSDQAGANPSTTGPNSSLGIVFSANGATNESSTVLDVDKSATSLTINSANTVGISGTHTLTLSNNAAIITSGTAGATTIGANINLTGALPSIAANSANPLTISGTVEGSTTGLQLTGTGLLVLSGTNTYTGTTNISSGTVRINNAGSLGASANAVTFTGGTSGYLQVAPGAGTLTDPHNIAFGNIGAASTVDNNGNVLVLSGSVTGSGTYVSAGSGTTQLTGAVSGYTGNVSVAAGALETGNGGTSGALATTVQIAVSANSALMVNLSGATNFTNTITGSGTLVQNGPAGSNLELSGSQSISNYVVNSGTMSLQGSASVLFGGGLSPTGSITVNSGAEFLVLKGDAIGGSSLATPNVTITLNSGTLNDSATGGGGLTFGNLNLNDGTVIANSDNFTNEFPSIYIRGTITVGGTAESFIQQTQPANAGYNIRLDGTVNSGSDSNTFNVGVTGAPGGVDLAVSANLEDGYPVGAGGFALANTTFIKTGAGTMSLSGSNAWGGGTQINGGVLELLSANALPLAANAASEAANNIATGTVGPISFGGGTLEYSSSNTVDYSGNIANSGSAISINVNGQTVTYASSLVSSNTGGLTLTATGGGELILSASNAYTGTTSINSGTLNLGNANALAGGGNITFGGGELQYSAGNAKDYSGRIVSSGSAIKIDLNGQVVNFASALASSNTGGLVLLATGGGTLDLSGANSYTGTTAINGGLLGLNNAGALGGGGNITFGGGALQYSASNQADYSSRIVSSGSAIAIDLNGQAVTYSNALASSNTGGIVLNDSAGGGELTLNGANAYSGSTIVNGGQLNVLGSLGAGSQIAVNLGGILSGAGGTVNGSVTVNSGGRITAGKAAAPGTLNLGNGLTLNSNSIAAFNILTNGSANDELAITGNLTLNSGAILQVTSGITISGTYALITYTGNNSNTSLSGITEQSLTGGSLSSSYSFVINGNTVDLVIASTPLAIPGITITSPAANARVMENTNISISGSISNSGTNFTLSGTLSDAGLGLPVSNLTPTSATVPNQSSVAYSGSLATGSVLGSGTFGVTVTDGSASPASATASGTLNVLQNRLITTTGSVALGTVHAGTVVSGTTGLTSPGADNQNTRLTIINTSGTAGTNASGISAILSSPGGTFNGSFSETVTVTGTLSTPGTNGTITLSTASAETGGQLQGEVDQGVTVNYAAQVFSGHATWSGNGGNGVWSTSNNWGDTNANDIGGAGAPGISGALSIGDTATFGDYAGEVAGGTTTINLNGASPTLASMTFNSGSTTYVIATGTGAGVITLQNNASMNISTGTATIATNLSGTGVLNVSGSAGTDLIWSGSESYTGSTNITSGTLTIVNPTWLGQHAGTNIYNINSGAALQLDVTSATFITDPMVDTGTFEGSGTLQFAGTGGFYISQGKFALQMSPGAVIEVQNGATLGSGGNGAGGLVTTNNQGTLQLDSGGSINVWNNGQFIVDALTGSGTVNRIGFGNNGGGGITFGIANGSGTFAGTITNSLGTLDVVKAGAGIEVLTGSNTYSGSTAVIGGILRITNSYGLGSTGLTFAAQTGQHTTTVSGSATLDVYNGITLNNAITLNNGSLINSGTGTSVLDNGIAGVTFATDPNLAGPVVVTFSGTGGAAASGSYVSSANFGQVYNGGGANGTANDYVQMTAAGSGYTPSSAPTVTITVSGSGTGTDTAVVSQLTLVGTNNYIGGNGNLTINAQISGSGGFTMVGTGTLTLTAAEVYTGTTTIAAGSTLQFGDGTSGHDGTIASNAAIVDNSVLVYDRSGTAAYGGTISGPGTVIVEGTGTQILAGVDTYTGSTIIAAPGTLQLGSGTTDASLASGTISNAGALVFATAGSRNYAGLITGTGSVSMSGAGNQEISGANNYTGATFINSGTLQLGGTSALGSTSAVTVSGSGSLSFSNGSTTQTTTLSANGQTLALNNGSNLVFGVSGTNSDQLVVSNGAIISLTGTTMIDLNLLSGTGGTFVVITDTNGFQGSGTFALGSLPSLASNYSLIDSGTTVTVAFTGIINKVYWEGTGTSGGSNWSDYTNFTSDAAGTTQLTGTFGAQQDVVFSASGAANQNFSIVDYNAVAKSLTINDPTPVYIDSFNSNTLTLASSGITTGSGAAAAIIGQPGSSALTVILSGTPNITVYNAGGLTVGATISGSNGLLVNGTDTLSLGGVNNYTGGTQLQSGTLNIVSDSNLGTSGSGNGVVFNPGAGNNVTLQSGTTTLITAGNRTFAFNSGTGTIDPGPAGNVMTIAGPVTGTATLNVVDTGQLILSGSVAFNGNAIVSSGTLTLSLPGTLAQTGSSTFSTAAGATLQLVTSTAQNLAPAAGGAITFSGSGTLLITGPLALEVHGANGPVNFAMSGGTIEVAGGLFQNGGTGGNGFIGNSGTSSGGGIWTSNLASLQIDSGASFDPWDITSPIFDALTGSGTLTRLGYFNADNSLVTIGVNNGSGTFSGVITNVYGTNSILKQGTGTETFSGNNSYSGSTSIIGGTLRITTNTGLGFGGPEYTKSPPATVNVSGTAGSAALDLYGGITVDKAITLNGGSLVNSGTGTSILDNGIASVALSGQQNGTYTAPTLNGSGGNGTGATFTAGTGTSPGSTDVYGEILTPGSGYTIAPTLVFSDTAGPGTGVSATAVLSSLTLVGNNNLIGGNGNLTINAQISGGGFSTTGTGSLTLTGSNSYTGPTNVNSGVFAVNGSLAAGSTVTVGGANANGTPTLGGGAGAANGGTLSSPAYTLGTLSRQVYGSSATIGNIQGAVTVNGPGGGAAGILAPGNSVGTLTVGSLTMNAGSIANYEFNGSANDFTAVTNGLSLTGVGFNLYIEGTTNQFSTLGTYALFSYGTTASISGLTVLNQNGGDTYTFTNDTTDKLITLTIAASSGSNTTTLAITPGTISLGNVLAGHTPGIGTGTLTNTGTSGSGNADYTTSASGGIVGVTPTASVGNGGTGATLSPGGTQVLTVTGTHAVGTTSGMNIVTGSISATDTSNNPAGNALSVSVTANIYNVALVSSGSGGQTLTNTGTGNLVASAKVQSNTINAASTQNAAAWSALTPTIAAGGTGTVESFNSANRLNGTYNGSATIQVGNVATDGSAITGATTGDVLTSSNYAISATVTGNASSSRSNVFSAQILTGSSYAGYSLSSSVAVTTHTITGSGGKTQATILAGTASGTANVSMSFDSTPVSGPDDTAFRTSDILTLTGVNQVGTRGDGVVLTDEYVLQLSYDTSATGIEYIGQNTGSGWFNTVAYNSNNLGNIASQKGNNPFAGSYALYLSTPTGSGGGQGLTLAQQLGAYGYSGGLAWAVIDHTANGSGVAEFAVIPEPGTCALVFSGFALLLAFRRGRRRSPGV